MVVEQVVFYSSITPADYRGVLVCADSAGAGGVQNYGKQADIILHCSLM